jgi:hypothetical protein
MSRSGIAGSGNQDYIARQVDDLKKQAIQGAQYGGQLSKASIQSSLKKIPFADVHKVLNEINDLHTLAGTFTPLTDPESVTASMFSPRMYDRVFSVIVDPYEFEIDKKQTCSTVQGKQVFDMLFQAGAFDESNQNKLKFIKGDKLNGDVVFEKYFVTVETFDGSDVL